MSKRSQTTITFKVTMVLPDGANAATAQQYVRTAIISSRRGLDPNNDPFSVLDIDKVTVALQKKEVVYGN